MPTEAGKDLGGITFAAGFVALGAYALYDRQDMSPLGSVFPTTIASAMILFALAYIVFAVVRPAFQPRERPRESTARRAALVVTMLAWAGLLEVLGFVAASLIAFLVVCAVANYDRWTRFRLVAYSLTGLSVVTGFYALFAWALKVPLPEGVLF